QHWRTNSDAIFQRPHEIGISLPYDLEAILALHVFHPTIGLALRINHQWPSASIGSNDSIFDGKRVCWKSPYVPILHLHLIHEHVYYREILWNHDSQFVTFR